LVPSSTANRRAAAADGGVGSGGESNNPSLVEAVVTLSNVALFILDEVGGALPIT
jgi:hypothetical protein